MPRRRPDRSDRRRKNQGQAAQTQQAARDRDPNLRRQLANTQDFEFQGSRLRGPVTQPGGESAIRGPSDPAETTVRGPSDPVQSSLRGPSDPAQSAIRGPSDPVQSAIRGPSDPVQSSLRGPVTSRDQQIPPDDQFNQAMAAPGTTAAPERPAARIDENNPPAQPSRALRSQPARLGVPEQPQPEQPRASQNPSAAPAAERSPSETLSDMVAPPETRRDDSGLRSDGRTDLRGTSADVDDPRFQAQREQDRQAELPGRLPGRDRNPTDITSLRDLTMDQRGQIYRERDRQARFEEGDLSAANPGQRRALRQAFGANTEDAMRSELTGRDRMAETLRQNRMSPEERQREAAQIASARANDARTLREGFEGQHQRRIDQEQAEADRQMQEGLEGGRNLRNTQDNMTRLATAQIAADARAGAGAGRPTTSGQSVYATFAGNQQQREALQARYGTEDAEEIATFIDRDIENRWGRTDTSRLPDYMTDESGRPTAIGQQVGQDLTALDLALSDKEHIGMWRALTGAREMGSPVDFNTSIERLQDFVVSGEQARWMRGAKSNFGGRSFETGDLPGEARQLFERLTGAVRNSILLDESEQGDRSRLQLARNERRETLNQMESAFPVSGSRRKTLLGTTDRLRNIPADSHVARKTREDALNEMRRKDRVPVREWERRRPAYEAELDRMIEEWRELDSLTDVEYAERIRLQALQEQTQGRVNEELGRLRGN